MTSTLGAPRVEANGQLAAVDEAVAGAEAVDEPLDEDDPPDESEYPDPLLDLVFDESAPLDLVLPEDSVEVPGTLEDPPERESVR